MPQADTGVALELESFGMAVNAAVVGASGGIGGALADHLERCHAVANIVRLSRSGPQSGVGKGAGAVKSGFVKAGGSVKGFFKGVFKGGDGSSNNGAGDSTTYVPVPPSAAGSPNSGASSTPVPPASSGQATTGGQVPKSSGSSAPPKKGKSDVPVVYY